MNYRDFSMHMRKHAATVMTPEAQQAAAQPPMDPSMAGGAPMPPAGPMPADPGMGGAPMPAGPAPAQGAGQIPPEILQDQQFMQQLVQMGAQVDPSTGTVLDPSGQPVPPEIIVQAYQQYMQAMQGMPPQGAAPADPSMGAAPMPADPSMAGAPMPADPAAGAQQAIPDDIMNQISTAVMSGVESVLQDFSQQVGKVLQELTDKLDKLSGDISALADTDDRRTAEDRSAEDSLRAELSADLNPVKPVEAETPVKEASATRRVNIFDLINGR